MLKKKRRNVPNIKIGVNVVTEIKKKRDREKERE